MKVAVDLKQVVTFSQTMFSWDMCRWAYDDWVDAKLYIILYTRNIVIWQSVIYSYTQILVALYTINMI
jgi:hypothetical protein